MRRFGDRSRTGDLRRSTGVSFDPVGQLTPLFRKFEPRLRLKRGREPFRFLFALDCFLAAQFRLCHLIYETTDKGGRADCLNQRRDPSSHMLRGGQRVMIA
jgi:hypothetical protein